MGFDYTQLKIEIAEAEAGLRSEKQKKKLNRFMIEQYESALEFLRYRMQMLPL